MQTVALAEDGEAAGGRFYGRPALYAAPFPHWALDRVRLDAYDQDAQRAYWPNFDVAAAPLRVFVSRLPAGVGARSI